MSESEDQGARGRTAETLRATRRRTNIANAVFVALAIVSLAVVIMSYFADVVPDHIRDALDFLGWRFAFLVLSVALIGYVAERETQFRRTVRAFETEQARIAEMERARADIVAGVTHELKTPLTSLLGYAQLLRKRGDSLTGPQRDEYIDVIERQTQRILHLIEGLLQSSWMESSVGRLERRPVDLVGLSRAIAKEMGTARGRTIEVEAPPEDLGLFGDPTAIEHVLTNLLDNALKYSQGDVVVSLSEGEGEVLVSVRDEGAGIAAEELPHIFERFRQANDRRGDGSVGLGLYIVRNLVEAHGGRIWVESEQGRGARFTVALPRRRDR